MARQSRSICFRLSSVCFHVKKTNGFECVERVLWCWCSTIVCTLSRIVLYSCTLILAYDCKLQSLFVGWNVLFGALSKWWYYPWQKGQFVGSPLSLNVEFSHNPDECYLFMEPSLQLSYYICARPQKCYDCSLTVQSNINLSVRCRSIYQYSTTMFDFHDLCLKDSGKIPQYQTVEKVLTWFTVIVLCKSSTSALLLILLFNIRTSHFFCFSDIFWLSCPEPCLDLDS